MKSAKSRKDKFERLCRISADVSSAPYTSKLWKIGKKGYMREYDIILLVGLTELKAQVSWVNSKNVRGISFNPHPPHSFHSISICANPEEREKVCSNAF